MSLALVLDGISLVLLLIGSLFCVIGGIGLNRLPDFYSRSHAVGVTDTMGAGMVMVGLMFQAPDPFVLVKLIAVLTFLLITSPISSHAVTRAAWRCGLNPVLDPNAPPAPTRGEE
ncbi:MAG: monovalent cation/H(+) antiporter subunit G [Myxococcota bacterium]